jgi:hypothetical protein
MSNITSNFSTVVIIDVQWDKQSYVGVLVVYLHA